MKNFLKKEELPKPYAMVVEPVEHPSEWFRRITSSANKTFKAKYKEQINNKPEKIKKIQESINNETKQLIKKVEFIKQTPRHPRYKLKDKVRKIQEELDKLKDLKPDLDIKPVNDAVIYLKTIPAHPRTRLARLMQIFNDTLAKDIKKMEVEFIKQIPSHPRERLARLTRANKGVGNDVIYLKTTPSHPRYRLQRTAKAQLEGITADVVKQIEKDDKLRKRVSKIKQPRIYLENEVMNELPNFNTKIEVTKLSLIGREKQIYDEIIKQLPPDNDTYYIEYNETHDAYIVRKEK